MLNTNISNNLYKNNFLPQKSNKIGAKYHFYRVNSLALICSRIINAFGKELRKRPNKIIASSCEVQFPTATLKYGFSYVR